MTTTAFLFPGQGAQHVGMAAELCQGCAVARDRFDQASAVCGLDLKKLCFEGPAEQLARTDVSQPAIFTVSMALLDAMKATLGVRLPQPAFYAGLSLGEYSALCAAGVFDFETGVDLVSRRGRYMQQAAEATDGAMLALMGADEAAARALCEKASSAGVIAPANFNCPGQIVLSGQAAAIDLAVELSAAGGGRGSKKLEVAGAFHSPLMASAAEKLAETLAAVEFHAPSAPVLSNVTGRPHEGPESIKQALLAQLTGSVLWQANCEFLLAAGMTNFYEIGPGKVLAGLMRRISREAAVVSVNSAEAVDTLAGV